MWEALVVEVAKLREAGAGLRGVIRGDREFVALHRALADAAAGFTEAVPVLHLRRTLLEHSDVSLAQQREACDLQKWLAAVVSHPEARHHPSFQAFVHAGPCATPTPDVSEPLVKRVKREPTLVRAPSSGQLPTSEVRRSASSQKCTKATLSWSDEDGPHSCELPVLTPTLAPPTGLGAPGGRMGLRVIDVRALGAHGFFTHDPGFTSTSSCTSAITCACSHPRLSPTRVASLDHTRAACPPCTRGLARRSAPRAGSI